MYKYFNTCRTAEEGKSLYRKLVKQYHTDNGGDEEIIKQINIEFSEWWKHYKDIHFNTDTGETYHSEKETEETAEDFIEIIKNLSTLIGIEVEQCGSWLWITGNTYPVKDQLTQFGCRYSKSKKSWYYAKDLSNYKPKHGKSMQAIRLQYGSKHLKIVTNPLLN